MPFVKLDCGILDSSLWSEKSDVRVVFLTMLAMASADGFVGATCPGIARRANLPEASVRTAMRRLEAPDMDSRTRTEDGRRLVRVDGGFRIVNYTAYRDRNYTGAARQKRYRERLKGRV